MGYSKVTEEVQLDDYETLKDKGLLKSAENRTKIVQHLSVLVNEFIRKRDKESALKLCNTILKITPENIVSLFNRATILYEKREYQQSQEDFKTLCKLFDTCVDKPVAIDTKRAKNIKTDALSFLLRFSADSSNNNEEKLNFLEIYKQCSDDAKPEVITSNDNSERDIRNLSYCFERMAQIVFSKNPTNADLQALTVDLRKVLFDNTARNKGGALLERTTNNIMLPSVPTVQPLLELGNIKLKKLADIPFGNGPIPAMPEMLLGIDDWLEQKIIHLGNDEYTIKQIFTFFGNIDGAHSDTTSDIRNDSRKSHLQALFTNEEMGYRVVFYVSEFLLLWLGFYDVLVDNFQILRHFKHRIAYSDFHNGFILKGLIQNKSQLTNKFR